MSQLLDLTKLKIVKKPSVSNDIILSNVKILDIKSLKPIPIKSQINKKENDSLKPRKKVQLELRSFYDGTNHFLINWESGKLFTNDDDIKHIGYVKMVNDWPQISYLNKLN